MHGHPSDETMLRACDEELTPRDALRLEAHLGVCEPCRQRRQQLESAAAEFAQAIQADHGPSSERTAEMRRRLAGEIERIPAGRERSVAEALAVAAVAMLAAAVFGSWLVRSAVQREPELSASALDSSALPIRSLTPGAARDVTAADLCVGRVPKREQIPATLRAAILRDYQMENLRPNEYELDYLITPELGGATDRRNLWPEQYGSRTWNARVKDDLERLLPRLVCQGSLDLGTAQRDIATDWIAAYRKYFHSDQPIETRASRHPAADADDDDDDVMAVTRYASYPRR